MQQARVQALAQAEVQQKQWLVPAGITIVGGMEDHLANAAAGIVASELGIGGMMPSDDLLTRFQDDLKLEEQWRWNGSHYGKTSEAWLELMDRRKATAYPILADTYGDDDMVWWGRWRIFFMVCAEFFALNGGEEWYVSHYRFVRP